MRVFVLSTGRCGTTTFTYACKHMRNFTAGHETRARYVGADRLDYPDNHIEIDNRLSWFLGRLDQAYGDNPHYVHLTRDPVEVAESYARRMGNPMSIGAGHKRSILMDGPYEDLDICVDVTETMLANIEHFLRDKTHVMRISVENIEEDYSRFWDWIGAEGDKAAALAEWNTRYNDGKTRHGQIRRPARPDTELSDLREKCRSLSEKNRKLRATAMQDAARFEYADKLGREAGERLLATERKLAEAEARCEQIELLRNRDIDKLREEMAEQARRADALQMETQDLKKKLAETIDIATRHAEDRDVFIKYADELEAKFLGILRSHTWRIMGPYRLLMRKVKGALNGQPSPPNSLPSRPALSVAAGGKGREGRQKDEAALVRRLDDKLWGGFSRSAFPELSAIRNDWKAAARARSEAAYRLARWHSVNGDYEKALEEIKAMRILYPQSAGDLRQFIAEALFLCRLGRVEEARTSLQAADGEFNPTIQLMLANTWNPAVSGTRGPEGESRVLECLNAIYKQFKLSLVEKRDPDAPLSIDNLRGATSPAGYVEGAEKVTVIVPVFNAQDTIVTALTSISEQSWRNLEVLVVDDASTDASVDVIAGFCARDNRFRLIRRTENVGSYVCRNYALGDATGDFVTVHDSDDWSHPDKIRCQVESLKENQAPYNLAMWVRTTSELAFFGNSRTLHNLVRADHSSGLFPMGSLRTYGAWDAVRVSADTELFWRIESALGNKKWMLNRRQILSDCPLAFGRMSNTSLTQVAATQVKTIYHGVRKEYRDAADCWHSYVKGLEDNEPSARRKSFFPVPSLITPETAAKGALSTLIIADWNSPEMLKQGPGFLERAAALGPCALFHYPHYRSKVTAPLDPQVRRFAWESEIRVIAPGEAVQATNVIVANPGVFEHPLDRFPEVAHGRLLVVESGGAGLGHAGLDYYDADSVRQHLTEFFSGQGEWVSTFDDAFEAARGDAELRTPDEQIQSPAPTRAERRVQGLS